MSLDIPLGNFFGISGVGGSSIGAMPLSGLRVRVLLDIFFVLEIKKLMDVAKEDFNSLVRCVDRNA